MQKLVILSYVSMRLLLLSLLRSDPERRMCRIMARSSCSSPTPRDQELKECMYMYKTKTVHFFGHTTPIVLQNDNGPCPLLAICNVLLLKNILNLSPDITEVSQEELLSLVAVQLIDPNVNVNIRSAKNKDAGSDNSQQQNNDVIGLLPKLATGIDVNIKFRRIDDFEFTPERAIFDLLDIPLYHGWIVDPQDYDTVNAIGPKSYNDLMVELVALETQNMEVQHKNNLEENCIDSDAATTISSGTFSSKFSKSSSFGDSSRSVFDQQIPKGDVEEIIDSSRDFKLSNNDSNASVKDPVVGHMNGEEVSVCKEENMCNDLVITVDPGNKLEKSTGVGNIEFHEPEPSIADDFNAFGKDNSEQVYSACTLWEAASSSIKTDAMNGLQQLTYMGPDESVFCDDFFEKNSHDVLLQNEGAVIVSPGKNTVSLLESHTHVSGGGRKVHNQFNLEDNDPVYKDKLLLVQEADKNPFDSLNLRAKDEITPQQGELIRSFLRNNASQLTLYGLSCLQGGLKERELCVFFRNNHFSTMFKFEGELYLLATDQGYLNQSDLVWEKLNEVNGDTMFMTGDFNEFKVESHENNTWNEDYAITSTADYLATIGSASLEGLDINSDLQLALALQQQEFDQEPPLHNSQQ